MFALKQTRTQSLGKFTIRITTDANNYDDTNFIIVATECMPYDLILGNEFLRNVTTIMKDGYVCLKHSSVCQPNINCFACSVDGQVRDTSLREAVTRPLKNYRPCQTKGAPMKLMIVMKNDVPIVQRQRRLSPKKQEAVDVQIQEWLQNGLIRLSDSEYSSSLVLVKKKIRLVTVSTFCFVKNSFLNFINVILNFYSLLKFNSIHNHLE